MEVGDNQNLPSVLTLGIVCSVVYAASLSMALSAVRPMTHVRVSRHTITASPAAITKAIPLTQTGTVMPLTITSQPKIKRSNWNKAISEKRTIAMMVKGFVIFGFH
jgi:negative regulator of sigma E activity